MDKTPSYGDICIAFSLAAKSDDIRTIDRLLADHGDKIDTAPLFFSFYDAIREDRLKTAGHILAHTPLKEKFGLARLHDQCAHAGKEEAFRKICDTHGILRP